MVWAVSILSALHLATFAFYNSLYQKKRRGEVYRDGKDLSFIQMPLKRKLTKIAFAGNAVLVLLSFWLPISSSHGNLSAASAVEFGFFAVPIWVRYLGWAISFLAVLLLKKSLSYLAENYSPLFDSHRPFRIVQEGPYRKIRHPVYLSNMLIILGYVIAGASVWSLALGCWGWFYMGWSIQQEERYLKSSFPEYEAYAKTSYRLVPFLF